MKEGGSAGLIPSQFLEEKRKAFVRRDWDNSGDEFNTVGTSSPLWLPFFAFFV